jgi:hypothetical protein
MTNRCRYRRFIQGRRQVHIYMEVDVHYKLARILVAAAALAAFLQAAGAGMKWS